MGASSNVASRDGGLRCIGRRRAASAAVSAGLVLAVALLCCTASAEGQEASGVTFASAQPLTLTWAQLAHGKRIEVCNGGHASVSRFHVVPADFAFTRSGAAVAASSVISVTPIDKRGVPAGGCAQLLIRAPSETPLDAGEFSGALLLVAAGGGTARLPTTITTDAKKFAAPSGVDEPVTFSFHNVAPWSRKATTVLLLKEPAAGEEELAIGKSCNASTPDESDCPFIGNLYQGNDIVRVRVIGPSRVNPAKGVQELPIQLVSEQHAVGAYEGAVKLPGTSQAIKLKVNAKDSLGCAILALLLGVLLALVPQYWNGRRTPKRELGERADQLEANYKSGHVPGFAQIEIDREALQKYVAGVKQAINSYTSSTVILDTKSAAYKAIEESVELAELDARVFTGAAGLTQALGRLGEEVERTTKVLHDKEVTDLPQILKRAAEMLAPREQLGVGEATQRVKQAEQLLPLLSTWRKVASEMLTYVVWLKAVDGKRGVKTDAVGYDLLAHAGVELSLVRDRLFEAADASELAEIRSSKTFTQALDRVAFVAHKHNVQMPPPEQAPKTVKGKLENVGYRPVVGSALTMATVKKSAADVTAQAARPAKLPSRRLWNVAGDLLLLLLSVAVSIVAGLTAFYFGKSFGTLGDYLTVIVVGTAAQALLKAVLDQMSVLLHDISPAKPVLPARVLAVAQAPASS